MDELLAGFVVALGTASVSNPDPLLETFEHAEDRMKGLGWLLLWDVARKKDVFIVRTLAYLTAKHNLESPISKVVHTWLLIEGLQPDVSTSINILSGVERSIERNQGVEPYLRGHLWPLFRRLLESPHLTVKHSVLDTMLAVVEYEATGKILNAAAAASMAAMLGILSGSAVEHEQNEIRIVCEALAQKYPSHMPHEAYEYRSIAGALHGMDHQLEDVLRPTLRDLSAFFRGRVALEDAAEAAVSRQEPILFFRVPSAPAFSLVERVVEWFSAILPPQAGLDFVPEHSTKPLVLSPSMASFGLSLTLQSSEGTPLAFRRTEAIFAATGSDKQLAREVQELDEYALTRLHALLSALLDTGSELEVTLTSPLTDDWRPATILRLSPNAQTRINRLTKAAAEARQRPTLIAAEDVPQANTIRRVFTTVDVIFEGRSPTVEDLGLDVKTHRQVDYYKHAARVLGLLDERNTPTQRAYALRGLGEALRLRLVAIYFEDSSVGRAWMRWDNKSRLSEVDPNTAASFLESCVTELSGTTLPRRASCIKQWHQDLMPFHYSNSA